MPNSRVTPSMTGTTSSVASASCQLTHSMATSVATRPTQRAQEAPEPLRQERVDLVDVVDEPAHQVAGLDRLEEADVELLDLGDDVVPRAEERPLAGRTEREDLLPRGEPAEDRGAHERERRAARAARATSRRSAAASTAMSMSSPVSAGVAAAAAEEATSQNAPTRDDRACSGAR